MLAALGYFSMAFELLDGAEQVAFASVRVVTDRGFARGIKLLLLSFAGF